MVNINPAEALPHEVYEGTADGERWTMQRVNPQDYRLPWFCHRPSPGISLDQDLTWVSDAEASDLVRLVPARPVTRDDLPKSMALSRVYLAADGDVEYGFELALDAVVEHLNRAHPKPEPMSADSTYRIPREDYAYVDWPATCAAANERADRAEAEASRWCRAHAIVEQERDQAREQWKKWEHKADGWKARAEAVERERDEWRAEVEHTERLLDDRDDLYVQRERMERERDEAVRRAEVADGEGDQWRMRAEAAEARTAPADPVVLVIGESDVEACQVRRRPPSSLTSEGDWEAADQTWLYSKGVTVEELDEEIDVNIRGVIEALAVRRAIEAEAEQATDPVEPEGDVIVRDAHDRMWWVTDDGWTNGTSRLDHDWADVPKPIRVTYRAESEAKR